MNVPIYYTPPPFKVSFSLLRICFSCLMTPMKQWRLPLLCFKNSHFSDLYSASLRNVNNKPWKQQHMLTWNTLISQKKLLKKMDKNRKFHPASLRGQLQSLYRNADCNWSEPGCTWNLERQRKILTSTGPMKTDPWA